MVGDAKQHLQVLERDNALVTFASTQVVDDRLTQGFEQFIAVIRVLLAQHIAHEIERKGGMNSKPPAAVMTAQRCAISLNTTQIADSFEFLVFS